MKFIFQLRLEVLYDGHDRWIFRLGQYVLIGFQMAYILHKVRDPTETLQFKSDKSVIAIQKALAEAVLKPSK